MTCRDSYELAIVAAGFLGALALSELVTSIALFIEVIFLSPGEMRWEPKKAIIYSSSDTVARKSRLHD
jgi:hypothetical protein